MHSQKVYSVYLEYSLTEILLQYTVSRKAKFDRTKDTTITDERLKWICGQALVRILYDE